MNKVFTTMLIGVILICLWNLSTSAVKVSKNDWWNTDWEFRKEITIDHDMVVADFENFPILFHSTSRNFSDHAQYDGDDFVFMSSEGDIQCNHEIEYYDRYTGELIAWVNISSLSSTQDTTLYIYYGNPSCSNQENIIGTWDSDFVGVWHCNNEVDNDEGDIKDSTIYYNHGTTQNMETEDLVDGKMSKAINFGGTDEKVLVYDSQHGSLDLTDSITLECWWKADDLSNAYNTLIGKSSLMGAYQYEYRIRDTVLADNAYSLLTYEGQREDNKTHTTNTWYHGTITLDSNNIIFYNEGAISTVHDTATPVSVYGQFGFGAAGDYGNYFEGIIDEVRVSKISRSSSWIETSYNTMNSPSTFLSVGSEESRPVYNDPPNTPEIEGRRKFKEGENGEHPYEIYTTDPDGDDIFYIIDWMDGEIEVVGPYISGEIITIMLTIPSEEGNYVLLKVKARDIYGAESDWAILEITVPRTRTSSYLRYQWFLEQFPLLEVFLRIMNL